MDKKTYLTGCLMAMADSVPGVSGGTIAFIFDRYDQLINAVANLTTTSKTKQITSLKFLFKLGCGWIVGFIIAIFFITKQIDTHIYVLSSLFLGFIAASIPITIKHERTTLQANKQHLIFTLLGILLVSLIAYFGNTLQLGISTTSHLSFGGYIYLFIVAFLAISSMLLPGISGSTVLMIFGVYFFIIDQIKQLLTFDFSQILIVIVFGLGIVSGLIIATKVLRNLIATHRSKIIYLVEGLMIGSLYAICLGPVSLDLPALSFATFNIIAFIIGVLLITGLNKISSKMI